MKYAAAILRDKRIDRALARAKTPRKKRYLTKRDIQIALLRASKK